MKKQDAGSKTKELMVPNKSKKQVDRESQEQQRTAKDIALRKARHDEIMNSTNHLLDSVIELVSLGALVQDMEWGSTLERMEDGTYRYLLNGVRGGIYTGVTAAKAIEKAYK